MSFTKKTWTDRISEYPTRRTLTKEDGTTETVTVTREEGTISQEGDAYSAANMNDLEQRVADGFSTLSQDSVKIATKNTTSDSIAFGIDSNGNYGYIKEGADTVTPFKSQADINNAYNSGVAYADGRVNTSSASYNSGYANGKAINRIVAAGISGSHTFDISRFNDKSAGAFVVALPQSSSGSWTLQDWGGSHTNTVYINISKSVFGNTLSTNVVTGLSGNNIPFSYAPVYSVYYIGNI